MEAAVHVEDLAGDSAREVREQEEHRVRDRAGVVYGFAGQVDGILGRLREELGEEATAIATGGFAQAITPFCEQVDEVDDLLTLTGLKLIWERNRS